MPDMYSIGVLAFQEMFDSQKKVAVINGFKVFKDSTNSLDYYLNIKSKVEHKYGLFNKIKFDAKSYGGVRLRIHGVTSVYIN